MSLNLAPNIDNPDALYEKLIALHQGQSDAMAMRISARLILLLANHIGDVTVIEEAIAKAKIEPETEQ